jgi:hypothetical protein
VDVNSNPFGDTSPYALLDPAQGGFAATLETGNMNPFSAASLGVMSPSSVRAQLNAGGAAPRFGGYGIQNGQAKTQRYADRANVASADNAPVGIAPANVRQPAIQAPNPAARNAALLQLAAAPTANPAAAPAPAAKTPGVKAPAAGQPASYEQEWDRLDRMSASRVR